MPMTNRVALRLPDHFGGTGERRRRDGHDG